MHFGVNSSDGRDFAAACIRALEDAETKSLIGVSDVISATLKKQHEASRTMSGLPQDDTVARRPRKRKPGNVVGMTCARRVKV